MVTHQGTKPGYTGRLFHTYTCSPDGTLSGQGTFNVPPAGGPTTFAWHDKEGWLPVERALYHPPNISTNKSSEPSRHQAEGMVKPVHLNPCRWPERQANKVASPFDGERLIMGSSLSMPPECRRQSNEIKQRRPRQGEDNARTENTKKTRKHTNKDTNTRKRNNRQETKTSKTTPETTQTNREQNTNKAHRHETKQTKHKQTPTNKSHRRHGEGPCTLRP